MSLKPPIRGIFFDAGWTLFRPASNDWFINRAFASILPSLMSIPKERQSAAFARAMKYLEDNHLLTTEDEELAQFVNFYSILASELPELGVTEALINDAAREKVFGMENCIFFDDTLPTLNALRGRYKLGIISDTWPSIERILAHGGISEHFDTKTFSCNLGVCKPDARMYMDALEKMGLPAQQTVFIDDSEECLEGAEKLGIQTVQIIVNSREVSSGRYPQITRLSELIELLEKL